MKQKTKMLTNCNLIWVDFWGHFVQLPELDDANSLFFVSKKKDSICLLKNKVSKSTSLVFGQNSSTVSD